MADPGVTLVRNATEADLPRIVEIYNASIPGRLATADTEPVTVEARLDWFRAHRPNRHPLRVLTVDGTVTAWISLRAFYGRPAYQSTAEVAVYVAPEHQGRGHAKRLLGEMIATCPNLGIRTLLAFVFGHNDPSLRIFESFGFQRWGHLPKIAELDTVERDLVILGKRIG